ncbi:MAG: hypothetical protein ABIZ04_09670 [Opitutus sp.]
MKLSLNSSLGRAASVLLAFAGLSAQGYESGDPLVERTINHGEQMMGPSNYFSSRYYDFNNRGNSGLEYYFPSVPTLYLPPLPPVIGGEMMGSWGASGSSGFAAGIDRQTFYSAYTFLASLNELTAKDDGRVAVYHKQGLPLLDEIRGKLEALAGAPPAARALGLSELARQQDSRLQALAADAEAIRVTLVGSRQDFDVAALAGSKQDFNVANLGGRALRLDRPGRETLQLLFAASFYAGLSSEQRRLLPEIACGPAAAGPWKNSEEWSSGTDFFFLPATARIRPPADLPAALEGKIRAFVREKESLKSELQKAVLKNGFFFMSKRRRFLAELAEQQAPRLAALEPLAEEIRVGLAAIGFPDQLGGSSLPADLTERVGHYYARKVEARRDLASRLRELRSEFPTATIAIARHGEGLAITSSPLSSEAEASLAKFNAQQAERYTAFARESEILRREIEQRLANSPQRSTRTVDQLAADFAKAYAARENRERSRDYIRAVLEPGLSPAQRRLLFQATTAELEQAGASLQP